ncbi:MAG: peptidylprolyl isomerase [Gammaproteobacteria bacterium]|nr:peptidylprolyl isomerase [Gammaproteobacteria bacterium]
MKLPARNCFDRLLLALAGAALVTLVVFTDPAAALAATPIDEIVAVVDEDVVMKSELDGQMQRVLSQMRQQGAAPPPRSVFEKQVLERLILQKIQLQIAQRSGIKVDDESLNMAINKIASENGLSLRQFRQIIEEDGYSFSRFREDIRNEIAISRLRQREVENRIVVTDREIDTQLANLQQSGDMEQEYHIMHILVATPERADEAAREATRVQAEELRKTLLDGADFTDVARRHSDGQQAGEGGDLGWRKASQLPTMFTDVVATMNEGDVSTLIASPSGFHIIKLDGVRSSEQHVVDQTKVQHILIKPNELVSGKDARIRLEQLKLRIEGGDSFGDLARSHSDDRGSAVSGGDLGWVSPGDLVPEFEDVMNQLAPGDISEPFESRFGWHIVRVVDRRRKDDTEEVRRARARDVIRQRKIEEEYEAWLRKLRDEAYVEYRLPE